MFRKTLYTAYDMQHISVRRTVSQDQVESNPDSDADLNKIETSDMDLEANSDEDKVKTSATDSFMSVRRTLMYRTILPTAFTYVRLKSFFPTAFKSFQLFLQHISTPLKCALNLLHGKVLVRKPVIIGHLNFFMHL